MLEKNCNHKDIIQNMPLAFAYHKVIYDQNNKALDYIFLEVNKKFEELTGLEEDKIIGKKVTEIFSEISKEEFDWIKFFGEIALSEANKSMKKYFEPLDRWYKITAYSNKKEYFTTIFSDITEEMKKEKEIKYLAYKDSLTNLYNRRFFETELERLDTKRQLPISIIMGDLNGLKIINDSYGQKQGDQLLIKTAKLLKEQIREEDVLARYGGDEFTILLPQTTIHTAKEIVSRIKAKIDQQDNKKIPLSISFGTAAKEKEEQKMIEIIKTAEDEMYQNKLSESKSSKNRIVQSLLNTLSAKSIETKEHALRMTKLAFDFGEKLGLSNSELNRLSLLAALHDIGKTTIPEEILKKPAKLNDNEWEKIKKHPERGYKIASASEEFIIVADEIMAHHERWDGSGYPRRLEKEEIPYLARIINIIDAYDVMTHDRPYSKAMSKKEALTEIKNCAGSQFDSNLAAEFIKLMADEVN